MEGLSFSGLRPDVVDQETRIIPKTDVMKRLHFQTNENDELEATNAHSEFHSRKNIRKKIKTQEYQSV